MDHERTHISDKGKCDRIKYRTMALGLFKEGLGYKAVASKLNLSIYTVRDWYALYQGGFFTPEMKKPGNKHENILDSKIKEEIRNEHEKGMSISSLGRKYGKSKTSIRYLLKNKKEQSAS